MAIALIALASSAGIQTTQAQVLDKEFIEEENKKYIENMFAIAWFEDDEFDPRLGKHKLYLMSWKESPYADENYVEFPMTARPVHVFNEKKKSIDSPIFGVLKLNNQEGTAFHNVAYPTFPKTKELDAKITFYLQTIKEGGFNPAIAMKLEVFPNRKIAKISLDNGFRRIVPIQKYKTTISLLWHTKQPPTAINFGPIK